MTVDELAEYGVNRMDDAEIRDFLLNQGMGVLGLPTEDTPYLLPMSYGFDGDSRLYFTYVLGDDSRKDRLSDRSESAAFLAYSADTMFVWESVLLTGTLDEVPEDEWDDVREAMAVAWRPDLFREASRVEGVKVYRLEVEERSGIKHVGLPPGFEPVGSDAGS
jgi:uncharacterized protein